MLRRFAQASIVLALLASIGARADVNCGKALATSSFTRMPKTGEWVRGRLKDGLGQLIESARRPGNHLEDAAVFSLGARAWATPRFERRGVEPLRTRLVFDGAELVRTLDARSGTVLVHTHPAGLHELNAAALGLVAGSAEDDFLHILNSLPSFADVRLAKYLAEHADRAPGFWIVSPRYVLSVRVVPEHDHTAAAHAAVFRDLMRQMPAVRARGEAYPIENVINAVNRRWRALRVRVIGNLLP